MKVELHPWYGLLTFAYMVGMYGLSSHPELGVEGQNTLIQVSANLFHVPLYAGLTFCFARAVSGGRAREKLTWQLIGLTVLGTGIYAGSDEWHQSFVPGRYAALHDILLDFIGIVGTLLILRLRTIHEADPVGPRPERRSAELRSGTPQAPSVPVGFRPTSRA